MAKKKPRKGTRKDRKRPAQRLTSRERAELLGAAPALPARKATRSKTDYRRAARLGWERRRALDATARSITAQRHKAHRATALPSGGALIWQAPRDTEGRLDADAAFALLADIRGALGSRLLAGPSRGATRNEKVAARALGATVDGLQGSFTVRAYMETLRIRGASSEVVSQGYRNSPALTLTGIGNADVLYDAIRDLFRKYANRNSPKEKTTQGTAVAVLVTQVWIVPA